MGDGLASWSPPEVLVLEGTLARMGQNYAYRLYPKGRRPLDPKDPGERSVLSALARRLLQERLRRLEGLGGGACGVPEGARPGARVAGAWGAVLDLWVSDSGAFLLEVDPAYRILCEMSLGPGLPKATLCPNGSGTPTTGAPGSFSGWERKTPRSSLSRAA